MPRPSQPSYLDELRNARASQHRVPWLGLVLVLLATTGLATLAVLILIAFERITQSLR